MRYQAGKIPLVVFAGQEYGTGSSRDWAAKGTRLLGVRAVVAQSFERIHRSNLVGMGVLPCQFQEARARRPSELDGTETFDLAGLEAGLQPRQDVDADDPPRGRQRATRSRSSSGSTRRSRSTTTATAASCRTCCASS